MKLYSLYTNHHKIFKDQWFLPSLKDDFDLNIKEFKINNIGEIGNDAFKKAMLLKVSTIIEAIENNINENIVYSDIDIQFFKPFKDLVNHKMKNYDLLIQRDSPYGVFCAGFMIINCNYNTLKLFKRIKEIMLERNTHDDQQILNELLFYDIIESNILIRINVYIMRKYYSLISFFLKKENKSYKLFTKYKSFYNLNVGHLPASFFSGGTCSADVWEPNKELSIPQDIILHHANWTIGIENKIKQLKYVKEEVQRRFNF